MNLNQWAIKWGVPFAAVEDLRQMFGTGAPCLAIVPGTSESAVQSRVRLEASGLGHNLMRNNNGASLLEDGSFVRWGLGNDSKNINKVFKSSDLIGIRRVFIEPYHVGTTLGVFMAREIKRADWVYRGTPEEVAQLNFLKWAWGMGADACFANSRGTI